MRFPFRLGVLCGLPLLALGALVDPVHGDPPDYPQGSSQDQSTAQSNRYAPTGTGSELGQGKGTMAESSFVPVRHDRNPVFTATGGQHAENPELWKENGVCYMYYSGKDSNGVWNVHLATSQDMINWTEQGQLLARASAGWDSGGVWSPSVTKIGATYFMYYDAFDPSQGEAFGKETEWKIGLATAPSIAGPWNRYGSSPIVAPDASSWDSAHTYDQTVIKIGTTYYMYYAGSDARFSYRSVGIAASTDGYTWKKFGCRPILNDNIEALKSFTYNNTYYLVSDEGDSFTQIYLYYSKDGITWKRHASSPILKSAPNIPWEDRHLLNAAPLVDGKTIYLIYQGNGFSDSIHLGLAQALAAGL